MTQPSQVLARSSRVRARSSVRRVVLRLGLVLSVTGLTTNCGYFGIEPFEASGTGGEDSASGGNSPDGGANSSGGRTTGGRANSGGTGSGASSTTGGASSGGAKTSGGAPWGGTAGYGGGGQGGAFPGGGGVTIAGACSKGDFGPLEPISGLAVEGDLYAPSVTADGLLLAFAASTPGSEKIYIAERPSRGEPFGKAVLVDLMQSPILGTPFISADGLEIYFTLEGFGGPSSRDLWVVWRQHRSEVFGARKPLDSLNTMSREHSPWLSYDRKTILFTTSRQTDASASEIWWATRENLEDYNYNFSGLAPVPTARVDSEDRSPSLSPDGLTLYFTSDRRGEFDVWSMKRPRIGAPFGEPVLEESLSEQGEEVDARLSPDGHEMFLSSSGDKGQELFVARRECQD
jgi:Tol biopolymer transport system component